MLTLFHWLGAICDDFFVPVLEIICEKFKLNDDVAGATFMAAGKNMNIFWKKNQGSRLFFFAGTSAPELFTNIMGTFVTKSDLGIGTIVGSAVFNIFGVISVCGIFGGQKVALDWYPISRDCMLYGLTVITLFIVLVDERVLWWEAMIMVILVSFKIFTLSVEISEISATNFYVKLNLAKYWVSKTRILTILKLWFSFLAKFSSDEMQNFTKTTFQSYWNCQNSRFRDSRLSEIEFM